MHLPRFLPVVAVIASMVIWGSTFVVTKVAATEIPALSLACLRFVAAAVVLVPLAVARGALMRLPKPLPWGVLTCMAFSGMALFTIAFNYALMFASASQGAFIFAALPAAIALAAVLILKERPTPRRIGGVLLSVMGVVLVIANAEQHTSSPQPFLGALWMLGAVLAWTVYTVIAKRIETLDQIGVITWVTLLAVVMLLPLAAIETAQRPWAMPSLRAWMGVVFLGVVASALAYVAYGYALRHLEASLVGVFTNLDPIVGVLTAVLLMGEPLHPTQIVGGVVALSGMWLASATTSSSPDRTPLVADDGESQPHRPFRS
ncbi:MAG: DMT family transporter [Steroidobacteraceae bacterium]